MNYLPVFLSLGLLVVVSGATLLLMRSVGSTYGDSLGMSGIVASIAGVAASLYFGLPRRNQLQKLPDFSSVFESTKDLLAELDRDEHREKEFAMIAASPAFGLELNEQQRQSWDDLIARCAVSRRFRLLCLSPLSKNSDRSPLDQFVEALADYPRIEATETKHLLLALRRMDFVGRVVRDNPLAVVRAGIEPPFQVSVLSYEDKPVKAIIYFSSTQSIRARKTMFGYKTEDTTLCQIFHDLYTFFETRHAPDSLGDVVSTPEFQTRLLESAR